MRYFTYFQVYLELELKNTNTPQLAEAVGKKYLVTSYEIHGILFS